MYRTVYGRDPEPAELRLAIEFIASTDDWPGYARVLLSSNEFLFAD